MTVILSHLISQADGCFFILAMGASNVSLGTDIQLRDKRRVDGRRFDGRDLDGSIYLTFTHIPLKQFLKNY